MATVMSAPLPRSVAMPTPSAPPKAPASVVGYPCSDTMESHIFNRFSTA
jgi:hypothetical protein